MHFLRSYFVTLLLLSLPVSYTAKGIDYYKETLQLLEEHGLPFDHELAQRESVRALLATVDPMAAIYKPSSHQRRLEWREGKFFGPGFELACVDGQATVARLKKASPAGRVGVRAADIIESINGEAVNDWRFARIVSALRFEEPHDLELGVKRAGEEGQSFKLECAVYGPEAIAINENLPENLAYLKLNGLYKDSADEIRKAIVNFSEAGRYGLLLDLRDANGYDVDAVSKVAGLLTPAGGLLFQFRDREGEKVKEFHAPEQGQIQLPTMILINQHTSGASEVLAGVLLNSGVGAMVFGEVSSGDMGLRDFVSLSNGEQVLLATRSLTLSGGEVYSGRRGLSPDVLVHDMDLAQQEIPLPYRVNGNPEDEEFKQSALLKERIQHDAVLQRAVDVLLGLKALNIQILSAGHATD